MAKKNEIREDVLGRKVLIAEKRAIRPHEFSAKKGGGVCYFCPGNEHLTPPEVFHIGEPWEIRAFPNKFPIIEDAHYVIVDTRNHDEGPFDSPSIFRNMIEGFKRLYYMKKNSFAYIVFFKNHGANAGASIAHSHSQAIGLGSIPAEVAARNSRKFMDYVEAELSSDRSIADWGFCPYASLQPYETWIFEDGGVEDLSDRAGDRIFSVARAIYDIIGEYSFNLNLFYPVYPDARLHFQLLPRINTPAGFEIGSRIIVNTLSPENAAARIREMLH